ncbi:MAG TPA: hypothetical protein VIT21_08205, partial [Chthoniobacterales bacterium]
APQRSTPGRFAHRHTGPGGADRLIEINLDDKKHCRLAYELGCDVVEARKVVGSMLEAGRDWKVLRRFEACLARSAMDCGAAAPLSWEAFQAVNLKTGKPEPKASERPREGR